MLIPTPVVWSSLCVATGGIPSSIVVQNQYWYQQLNKPSWNPPSYTFPIIWTALNAAIGWSACVSRHNPVAMISFAVNRCLSLAWTPIFFGQHNLGLANVIAALLCISSVHMLFNFKLKTLLVPYVVWLMIAFALNIKIQLLNTPSARIRHMAIYRKLE
jgi:tryptophan-rich sensory protein